MDNLTADASRVDILRFISRAATYGNLGLFIGAGFSKAVLNDGADDIALSWGELLGRASEKIGVDFNTIAKEGASFPEIASRLCKRHSSEKKVEYKQSLSILKRTIADLTSWYPDQSKREKFSGYLQALDPSWIITTNYDLVIEALLTGKSIPLGPNDSLSSARGVVPVYHLHGIRTNPEEIIIAQEDYVALFRPNEYRQIKLALTVKESTTLLLGYGLGDVNVLTALDWSSHVFSKSQKNYPHEVIQVLRKENARTDPYQDDDGTWIVETQELEVFMTEYVDVRTTELVREESERQALKSVADQITNPGQDIIEKFIDDQEYRKTLIKGLSAFPIHLVSGFISLMDKSIDETWNRSIPYGAFEGYNQNLTIILDILAGLGTHTIPPALFQSAAYGLNRVANRIGYGGGQSWAAGKTWDRRKAELSAETVQELRNIADQHWYVQLKSLLAAI